MNCHYFDDEVSLNVTQTQAHLKTLKAFAIICLTYGIYDCSTLIIDKHNQVMVPIFWLTTLLVKAEP